MGRTRSGTQRGRFRDKLGVGMDPSPEQVQAAIKQLGKDLTDWRPAWVQIAPIIRSGIVDTIKGRGSPIGASWPGHERKYLRRKLKQGFSRAELYRTGRLVASILSEAGATMTKLALKVGTSLPYARAMQFGYTRTGAKGGIGKRPFMGLTPAMRDRSAQYMSQRARELVDMAASNMQPARAH